MYSYLAGAVRNHGCECYRAGGVADHVHLGLRLSRTLQVAELVKELKVSSNKWIKGKGVGFHNFAWQKGYGAFSLGISQQEDLIRYIDRQETHHQKTSFQEEYRDLLNKYEIEFDERYVWD